LDVRKRLSASNDILELPRYSICTIPNPGPLIIGNGRSLDLSSTEVKKKKCLLLREGIKHDGKDKLLRSWFYIPWLIVMVIRHSYLVSDDWRTCE
jgi:hypothetical protein